MLLNNQFGKITKGDVRMKKGLVVLVMMFLAVCVAQANVAISWQSDSGYYFTATPAAGLLGDGSGNSALAQLIWSPDNIASVVNNDAANHYIPVADNDIWLADLTITEDGVASNGDEWGSFGSQLFNDGGSLGTDGYVYGRYFQDDTPVVGDWVYLGPIQAATDQSAPVTPEGYNFNRSFGDAVDGGDAGQIVPVPEPASFLLFGLGAVVMGLRRKRRK